MEVLSLLADGFATSLSPFNLFIVIIGVTAGLFIGAMPGLGSVNGVAIVLPLTFIVPIGPRASHCTCNCSIANDYF